MAVPRARAWALAVSVPVVFAFVAALLSAIPFASASPLPSHLSAPALPGSPAAPTGTGGVVRSLVRPSSTLPVAWRLRPQAQVVFLTIDDGVDKDRRALRLVERGRIPITAFLTTWTIKDQAEYFRRITRWGSIQNHTATHASLARSSTDLDHEICGAQRVLKRTFGTRPWLMRPPYGQGFARMETQVTARRCGVQRMVMWDAVVDRGRLSITNGRLRAGDVVLLHFTPHLAHDLQVALRAAHRAGLAPASLADYLPAS